MPSAVTYIHDIGEHVGDYGAGVTSSDGTTTSLVYDTFVNSNMAASELAEFSVLIESGACAGQMGAVKRSGLTRSTGTIGTADAFSSAILSGVAFSLYDGARLPPLREGVRPGLLQIVNQTLRYLWVEDTILLTGVSGQHYYTIDTTVYPWFTSADRVIEVRYPVSGADDIPLPLNTIAWKWESVGETRRLVFPTAPFATGDSIAVKVYRPANSRLKLNATARAGISGGGAVNAVTVVTPGYYTSVPTVTGSGGGGTGATFTAVLSGGTSGTLTSVTINAGGTGYTTPPTLSITAGAWADQASQTAGLLSLTDEAISDVSDVRTVCLWLAYRALGALTATGQTVAEWMAQAEAYRREAMDLEHFERPSNPRTNVAIIEPVLVGGWRPQRSRRGW